MDTALQERLHLALLSQRRAFEVERMPSYEVRRDRLQRLLARACDELGWIAQAGVCHSLDVKLTAAQDNWEKVRFHALREHAGLVFQTA